MASTLQGPDNKLLFPLTVHACHSPLTLFLPHAVCSSRSFWFSAATLAETSGGASAYLWNLCRWVPRPCVIECRVVEYLYSSASGTIARTSVSRPSVSVPRI